MGSVFLAALLAFWLSEITRRRNMVREDQLRAERREVRRQQNLENAYQDFFQAALDALRHYLACSSCWRRQERMKETLEGQLTESAAQSLLRYLEELQYESTRHLHAKQRCDSILQRHVGRIRGLETVTANAEAVHYLAECIRFPHGWGEERPSLEKLQRDIIGIKVELEYFVIHRQLPPKSKGPAAARASA